jgi:hypothetical protein
MARQNLKTISFNFFNSIVLRKTNFPEECLTKLRVQQNNMRLPGVCSRNKFAFDFHKHVKIVFAFDSILLRKIIH